MKKILIILICAINISFAQKAEFVTREKASQIIDSLKHKGIPFKHVIEETREYCNTYVHRNYFTNCVNSIAGGYSIPNTLMGMYKKGEFNWFQIRYDHESIEDNTSQLDKIWIYYDSSPEYEIAYIAYICSPSVCTQLDPKYIK